GGSPHRPVRPTSTRRWPSCPARPSRSPFLRCPGSVAASADCTCVLSVSVRFSRSSRGRLTDRDLARFPGETLLDRIGRATCHAGCLPRKELYEAWETARRVRRLFRGGRIVDLAAGHGLLAHVMLILDDTSPGALAVDAVVPPSAATLHQVLVD